MSAATNSRARRRAAATAAAEKDADPSIPMGKFLASPDKRVRDKAVRSLGAFLQQNGGAGLSEDEMAKLWKGLFYCFWMSDKPLVQQALAQELADLILITAQGDATPDTTENEGGDDAGSTEQKQRISTAFGYLEGFWDAMTREWPTLDKWRVDKFYMLIRRFLNGGLRLLAYTSWDKDAVERFNEGISRAGRPMCGTDVKVPASLSYHICDIYLDELEKVIAAEQEGEEEDDEAEAKEVAPVPILSLLHPFIEALVRCFNATLHEKLMAEVFTPILDDLLVAAAPDEVEEEQPRKKAKGSNGQASSKRRKQEAAPKEVERPLLVEAAQEPEEEELEAAGLDEEVGSSNKADKIRTLLLHQMFVAAGKPEANDARRRRVYKLYQEERARKEEA